MGRRARRRGDTVDRPRPEPRTSAPAPKPDPHGLTGFAARWWPQLRDETGAELSVRAARFRREERKAERRVLAAGVKKRARFMRDKQVNATLARFAEQLASRCRPSQRLGDAITPAKFGDLWAGGETTHHAADADQQFRDELARMAATNDSPEE